MKCAILKKAGEILIKDIEEPPVKKGEALLRIHACGICGSDLHSYSGKHPFVIYPIIPGHECSGEIVEVGEGVDQSILGKKACIEPSLFCGECPRCKSGRYNICDNLRVLGFQAPGAMCEYISVPLHRIHILPDTCDYFSGALVEPCAVAVHALSRAAMNKGDWILIIGGGVIGLMLLKVAKASGFKVGLVEAREERMRIALSFGADFATSPAEFQKESGPKFRPGEFAAVFECVGNESAINLAIRAAPRGSTVVVAGVFSGPCMLPVELIQDGEIEVKGTLMYMKDDFEKAIELILRGIIKKEDFITRTVTLEEVDSGFKMLLDPDVQTLKVMVSIVE